METLGIQLRQAARALARSSAFTLVAVLTLGVGVGAVTAIFTVLDRVALRPLPYPEADRLVRIEAVIPRQDPTDIWGVSEAGYFFLASDARTLDGIGAIDDALEQVQLTFSGPDGAVSVPGDSVTSTVLSLLGARPALGRLLSPSDERPGAPPVVLLSHDLWQGRFGADSTLVGRSVRVGGADREVIGVTVSGFGMPDGRARAWVPLPLDPMRPAANDHWVGAIGRLAPGVTLAEAQSELDELTARLPTRFPDAYSPDFMEEFGFRMRVVPLRANVIGTVDRTLWTLLAGVGLLLLVALANVANLFLVRSEGRRGELAIRTAMGAPRVRLVKEGAVEGTLVGGLAGLLGSLLATLALGALVTLSPPGLPRLAEVRLGGSGVGFALATALAAGLSAGVLPRAWIRPDLDALRGGGRAATPPRGWRWFRRTLVGAQVALAFILLAGMGLTVRSFDRLMRADPGFSTEGVLTFQVFLPESPYGEFEAGRAFYRDLSERVEALPSVLGVGAVESLPFQPYDGCWITYPAGSPLPAEASSCVAVLATSPGYLEAMEIPVEGRVPDWGDLDAETGEVVVSRSLAERYWPDQEPIGQTLRGYGWGNAPAYRVAGVAGNVYTDGVDQPPQAAVYAPIQPLADTPLHWGPYWGVHRELFMVVKTEGRAPEAIVPNLREIMAERDPDVVPGPFESMETLVARSPSVARATLLSVLLAVAAAIAIFLSAVALYGIVAYFVRHRTREIGLCMALGADMRQLIATVLREAAWVGGTGLVLGLAGALAAGRLLRSLLYEVHPNDAITLAGAAFVLGIVTLLAAYVPARRATRIDPMDALRAE